MSKQVDDVAVEPIEWFEINAVDLSRVIERNAGNWATYKIVPIGEDGYRQSPVAEMIFANDSKRAGIAWNGDTQWTDATDPVDAAERFFGIYGKEMCN